MIYISDLVLKNFRCYKDYRIGFIPGINIIVGNNAVGKTSLVEAVYCLGVTKSHKASVDGEIIKKGEEYSIIKGKFIKDEKENEIVLSINNKGKRIQRNNKIYQHLSEYIGFFNPVMFCPEDLELVKGAPSLRRRFLDTNLCQLDINYMNKLIKYRKLLKQRNEILKNISERKKYDETLLKIVTQSLGELAQSIIKLRSDFIEKLNNYLAEKSKKITNSKELVNLVYQPSCGSKNITSLLEENINNDILAKTTTVGPHRDDFLVEINQEKASIYSSQGQQRTASLALKLALADYINADYKDTIIILDDVFSELDIERQNELLKLMESKNQIFITTTTISNLSEEILSKSKIITIQKEVEDNE